jgi:hypothetical protein
MAGISYHCETPAEAARAWWPIPWRTQRLENMRRTPDSYSNGTHEGTAGGDLENIILVGV